MTECITVEDLFGTSDDEDAGGDEDFEGLIISFDSLKSDFSAHFARIRAHERKLAGVLLGAAAEYPLYRTFEQREEVARALRIKTLDRLGTFGYRRTGPNTMRYWVETESGIPDQLRIDSSGSIGIDDLPKELFNHVYIHHVYIKKRVTTMKAMATRQRNRPYEKKQSRPALLTKKRV